MFESYNKSNSSSCGCFAFVFTLIFSDYYILIHTYNVQRTTHIIQSYIYIIKYVQYSTVIGCLSAECVCVSVGVFVFVSIGYCFVKLYRVIIELPNQLIHSLIN